MEAELEEGVVSLQKEERRKEGAKNGKVQPPHKAVASLKAKAVAEDLKNRITEEEQIKAVEFEQEEVEEDSQNN